MLRTQRLLPFIISLILLPTFVGCSVMDSPSNTITVFAASSLHDAMNQVALAFEEQHQQSSVQLNFASSAQLALQLTQGAPADIFASADMDQMANAISAGRIASEPEIFATNQLVLLVPSDNPAGIHSITDLAKPNVRIILSVPGTPLRTYTDLVLHKLEAETPEVSQLTQTIMGNVVSEEDNARQVVAKVALGEADAAFSYRSDAKSELAEDSRLIELPGAVQVQAEYPIALVNNGSENILARQFLDFLLSAEGQQILADTGFSAARMP